MERAEDINISGSLYRNKLKYANFRRKHMNSNPKQGPLHYRSPSKILWRTIRGMVPHKTARGSAALDRLKTFEGIPHPYDRKKRMVVPSCLKVLRLRPERRFCRLGDLSQQDSRIYGSTTLCKSQPGPCKFEPCAAEDKISEIDDFPISARLAASQPARAKHADLPYHQARVLCTRLKFGKRRPSKPLDKLTGPSHIQVLRGSLAGREVALILCGEAHEDAVDLTRPSGSLKQVREWMQCPSNFCVLRDSEVAMSDISLTVAKSWAASQLTYLEQLGSKVEGALMTFAATSSGRGTAQLYAPCEYVLNKASPSNHKVQGFLWQDQDEDARYLKERRSTSHPLSHGEMERIIAKRKRALRKQGVQLMDDWLVRCCRLSSPKRRVELLMEGPVDADDVELHEVTPRVDPAPVAHSAVQSVEMDSGDEDVGGGEIQVSQEGVGTFLEYLRRFLVTRLERSQIHMIDARDLGDPDDDGLRERFQQRFGAQMTAPDLEDQLVKRLGLRRRHSAQQRPKKNAVPSWEAYFGAASELLYYSPHVKADFTPFLACVMKRWANETASETLTRFFRCLYCGEMTEAMCMLRSNDTARRCLRLRSMIHTSGSKKILREDVRQLMPVVVAPVDRFLKAKGFDKPRSWTSAIAERLRQRGLGDLADAAQSWYISEVLNMLQDPKHEDQEGDYFMAFLREAYREIYDDISHDQQDIRSAQQVPRLSNPSKLHQLGNIVIPAFEDAMQEILRFDPEKGPSTRRQRVLAKIIIDIFQLRATDLSLILSVAERAAAADSHEVVLIAYTGSDHSLSVEHFYRLQGFTSRVFPNDGLLGEKQPGKLGPILARPFPKYLQNLDELFRKCPHLSLLSKHALEVGWKHGALIDRLESQRKVKSAAFHKKKVATLRAKSEATRAVKLSSEQQQLLAAAGYA
ncbi:unnamed protein product [Effrenium voratum]|nr:unnamed protein product [Effrenium voratum]